MAHSDMIDRVWRMVAAADSTQARLMDALGGPVLGQNRRPIGARGLFYRWRTGSTLGVPNAIRVLVVNV